MRLWRLDLPSGQRDSGGNLHRSRRGAPEGRVLRLLACAAGLAGAALMGAPPPAPAKAPPCPAVIAALVPKGAARVTGMYQGQGIMALGGGTADLPFPYPCLTEKFPAKWSVELQHYEGEGIQLLQMQVAGYEQQVIQNEKDEIERRWRKARGTAQGNPIRVEQVAGGTVILSTQTRRCPWGGVADNRVEPPPIPIVRLVGVAHTDSTRITLKIEGDMSAEAALAAAKETFENLARYKFQP